MNWAHGSLYVGGDYNLLCCILKKHNGKTFEQLMADEVFFTIADECQRL
jgi:CubicO group peptidase (beta-lactamase class C family)